MTLREEQDEYNRDEVKHNILKKTLSRLICPYLDLPAVFWFMGRHMYAAITSTLIMHIYTYYAFLLHS